MRADADTAYPERQIRCQPHVLSSSKQRKFSRKTSPHQEKVEATRWFGYSVLYPLQKASRHRQPSRRGPKLPASSDYSPQMPWGLSGDNSSHSQGLPAKKKESGSPESFRLLLIPVVPDPVRISPRPKPLDHSRMTLSAATHRSG